MPKTLGFADWTLQPMSCTLLFCGFFIPCHITSIYSRRIFDNPAHIYKIKNESANHLLFCINNRILKPGNVFPLGGKTSQMKHAPSTIHLILIYSSSGDPAAVN
jgi:hypothetical protein